MSYIKSNNTYILTKQGLKQIEIVKKEFIPSIGRYVIREYKTIKKENKLC